MKKLKSSNVIFAYSTLGIQLAVFLLIFIYGGYKLDEYLDTNPLFIIVGAFTGMGAGFYHLIKSVLAIDKNTKEEGSTDSKDDNKWKIE